MVRKRKAADAIAAASANPPQDIPVGSRVDISALFPGLRPRHDGWTQGRTQRFLDTLAYTGCVKDAARVAGMSAVGARRMRRRFPRFDAAWNDALERGQQGLVAIAYKRAVEGRETVVIRKGEEYERRIAPSDALLSLLLKRGDLAGGGGHGPAEETLSLAEWRQHVRFDARGRKVTIEDPEQMSARFIAKMSQIRARLNDFAAAGGACPMCKQTLPANWPNQSMAELVGQGLVDPAELSED
jgi:hypothetical protein